MLGIQRCYSVVIAGAVIGVCSTLPRPASAQPLQVNPATGETQAQFAARTKWWRNAKFGMFIHWGIYAVPASAAGGAEWYLSGSKVQVKDYEKFAQRFNPVKFNAAEWAQIARDAGMKYMVITSKHHDGFSMFDSKVSDYTIAKSTPWHKDPMKALARECRKNGLRFCFYHSIMDWHHPDYLPRREWERETRPANSASLDRYIEDYMKPEIRELLTNYGPIGVIWFDGGWEHNASELHSAEVNRYIRSLQPQILINDRNQEPQDFSTPEQTIPAGALSGGRLWETCMTINGTWGYTRDNTDWKSTEDLVQKLCDIASKGGNFLLNVGPTDEGEFPAPIVERLHEMGTWMHTNGEAIYGTTGSPFRHLPFNGRCTAKRNRLYLHVFTWPDEGLVLTGLQTHVVAARALLSPKAALDVSTMADGSVRIARPKQLDRYATVIELRLAGKPVVTDSGTTARADASGAFALHAADATIEGSTARYEQGDGRDNIGYWVNAADYVYWTVDVPRSGRYRVEISYACQPDCAGSEFTVGVAQGPSVQGQVDSTGSWTSFRSVDMGTISCKPGKLRLEARAQTMPHGAVMNLQSIRLVPAP